jgi:hypothetical protein
MPTTIGNAKRNQQSCANHQHDQARIREALDAERDACVRKVERAVQDVRARHEHHAGTKRDEQLRIRQAQPHSNGTDRSSDGSGAKWLDERIATERR